MTARSRYPEAVLWDMDGTLIDSDPLWLEAERNVASEWGLELDASAEHMLEGASLPLCAHVLREAGVVLSQDAIAELLVAAVESRMKGMRGERGQGRWAAGALGLLDELGRRGVPSVLVTGSPTRIVRLVLEALPRRAFAEVITGDCPLPAKPLPDRYVAAARMVGADIRRCVIFEDSDAGLRSAVDSGAQVIAVTALARTPAPASPAYRRVRDFRELSAESLLCV
ncbi:HAD family hydrolase [Bifidobacterium eulemuris]|uniref:HAD family phosphatase n=1 Tax=Bifidobacterium eulemuris TaxID=1765219 RepID=A0A261FY29_9BIFI|nr:HAD family phosphatase [Bifidobacterium eulemuris]OZG64072.1 haloacid dehalogenase [Bifidobacterium eulemuris]QOL32577.1 HAD family phosphatase [Bifidobacterium eulemuris]